MADIIDTARHADLITKQAAVFAAFNALDEWTEQVGKRGMDWTDEERSRTAELRKEVCDAAAAKEAALYASGLVDEHGYYAAAQALKDAARTTA